MESLVSLHTRFIRSWSLPTWQQPGKACRCNSKTMQAILPLVSLAPATFTTQQSPRQLMISTSPGPTLGPSYPTPQHGSSKTPLLTSRVALLSREVQRSLGLGGCTRGDRPGVIRLGRTGILGLDPTTKRRGDFFVVGISSGIHGHPRDAQRASPSLAFPSAHSHRLDMPHLQDSIPPLCRPTPRASARNDDRYLAGSVFICQ